MEIRVFGKVRLEGSSFSRPKPLLLLAYLTLNGPQSRTELARLFWRDARAKANLSVMLSQFKKEGAAAALPEQPGLDPLESLLSCDALHFTALLAAGDLEAALARYQGSFLQDLGKPLAELDVSDELRDWVTEQRDTYAQQAQHAMLTLAERHLGAQEVETARTWAERAYRLPDVPEPEPAVMGLLQRLLSGTRSSLAQRAKHNAQASLNDLPPDTRRVFLALSLQAQPNLTVVRNALELPLSALAEAQETLYLGGLTDMGGQVLAPELAAHWLNTHLKERLPLLLGMARATPTADAFTLYQRVYAETQGFGGLGDMQKARAAYCTQARTLMDRLEFAQVALLMEQVRESEEVMGAQPEPHSIFLHAYALERSERFKDALETLRRLPAALHDPNLQALHAVLLWRAGKTDEARHAAQQVLSSGPEWLWAQATAYTALGYVASSGGDFAGAVSCFKKAAECYQAAGDRQRLVGVLNNQAVELSKMADHAKRSGEAEDMLQPLLNQAESAYTQALTELRQLERGNPSLEGRILLNLGRISETRQDWTEALRRYNQAQDAIAGLDMQGLAARLRLNLGIVHRHLDLTTEAQVLFKETISRASAAGEPQIQALAMNQLALMNSDVEQIELSLDLLEKAGGQDLAQAAIVDYRDILHEQVRKALLTGDAETVRRTLKRLEKLHLRLGHQPMAARVATALQNLSGSAQVPEQFDLSALFAELEFKEVAHATRQRT